MIEGLEPARCLGQFEIPAVYSNLFPTEKNAGISDCADKLLYCFFLLTKEDGIQDEILAEIRLLHSLFVQNAAFEMIRVLVNQFLSIQSSRDISEVLN